MFDRKEVPNFRTSEDLIFDKKYLPSGEKSVLARGYAPGPGTLFTFTLPRSVRLLKLRVQLFLYLDKKYCPF